MSEAIGRTTRGRRRVREDVPLFLLVALLAGSAPEVAAQDPAANPDGASECRVFGQVLDAESGDPVVGALVWLEAADDASFLAGRETSPDGSFSMETAACEPAVLRVDMIGYVDATEPVTFDGDDQMRAVTIRLERSPIELEELRVEVDRSLRLGDVGFYARKAWVQASGDDLGEFYDPEEIEGRSQAFHTVTAVISNSRIRFMYGTGCGPSYYIDGRWWRSDSAAVRMLEYGIQPKDIEGIEIYRPIQGSVPEEYRDPNSNTCGAVVVWTKESGPAEAPQIEVELCEPSDNPDGISFGGIVTDELTRVHLPASYVTLTTARQDDEPKEMETIADEDGRYRYCDLEAWPESVRARYGTATAEPFPIDPAREQAGYFEIDLMLGVVRPGSVVGVVAATDVDLTGTDVALEGTDLAVAPDQRGYFEIHDVMPGEHVVIVRRGDETLVRRNVSIRSGSTEAVTLDVGVP
ncbi:MAG: carboxypeptidase-like regulatory domain-containing protein [Gemmatimonadota bacterium]|nr:carboxypeptidase-like regulatory domain-containing protein [Gemmatimonadota bacterium]